MPQFRFLFWNLASNVVIQLSESMSDIILFKLNGSVSTHFFKLIVLLLWKSICALLFHNKESDLLHFVKWQWKDVFQFLVLKGACTKHMCAGARAHTTPPFTRKDTVLQWIGTVAKYKRITMILAKPVSKTYCLQVSPNCIHSAKVSAVCLLCYNWVLLDINCQMLWKYWQLLTPHWVSKICPLIAKCSENMHRELHRENMQSKFLSPLIFPSTVQTLLDSILDWNKAIYFVLNLEALKSSNDPCTQEPSAPTLSSLFTLLAWQWLL